MSKDELSKAELAKKYRWEEWHGEKCDCIYCVMMETLSRQKELPVKCRV